MVLFGAATSPWTVEVYLPVFEENKHEGYVQHRYDTV